MSPSIDFFVSYNHRDELWAEWVAWQLEDLGYSTLIQAWDFTVGNWVQKMDSAMRKAKHTIAVLSPNYLEAEFVKPEWQNAFRKDPTGELGLLILIRVANCELEGILGLTIYTDLVGLREDAARQKLADAVHPKPGGRARRGRPNHPPRFPGERPEAPLLSALTASSGGAFYTKIKATGVLDLRSVTNPYEDLVDATDFGGSERLRAVHCYLWLPSTEYIRGMHQPFIPAAAICTPDPSHAIAVFEKQLRGTMISTLDEIAPRKMLNHEREHFLVAMREALKDCFVVAVTVPEIILEPTRTKWILAYQTFVNVFLLPLVEMHRRLRFPEFHVKLAKVGDADASVIKLAKGAVRSCYRQKGTMSVDLATHPMARRFASMARLFAWAVSKAHNSDNSRWVSMLGWRADS